MRKRAARTATVETQKPLIRIRHQTGHGFWATIRIGHRLIAVQSPKTYGYETRAEARAAAKRKAISVLKEMKSADASGSPENSPPPSSSQAENKGT